MDYTASMYSDIDLVIRVTVYSEELMKTIGQINEILTKEYYRLIEQATDEFSYLIDIHIINDDPLVQIHPSKSYLEYIYENSSIAV